MHDTEQSWEVACQDLVQSLGVHSPANTLMEATLLADVLALSGERVHLYSQRVQHRFGTWAGLGKGEPQNIRWQTARKEEETLVGVQWGDRLVFPCGAGSLDTLLATEHDRWANVKAEGFSWQELSSSFITPPELLAWTPRNKATLSPSEAQAVDHWRSTPALPFSNLERVLREVGDQCLSSHHLQRTVHHACLLLSERGLACDGRYVDSSILRQPEKRRWRKDRRYEVVFHGEPGVERSQEVLPGVGVLFGWEYQTGERNGREAKTSLSSSWFPLTPPDSRNVLEQAQTLAAALIQHRLEQRLEHQPSASKPRF